MACVCNALITSALPYKLVAGPPEKWGTGDALLLPELVYVSDLQKVRLKTPPSPLSPVPSHNLIDSLQVKTRDESNLLPAGVEITPHQAA